MSNIMNPKPRFGYTPGVDLIYDYVTKRDVAPSDKPYETSDGSWDLNEVKRAILAGETIEPAHLTVRKPVAPAPRAAAPAAPAPAPAADAPKPEITLAALAPQQLQALKLSALQMAAMGITPTQLETTGVTAQQVKGWGLSEGRAVALQLTAEQRAVLMP